MRSIGIGSNWITIVAAIVLSARVSLAGDYKDADVAYREGTTKLRQMQYEEAREPLEAALKLAPDDAYRLKVHQALTQVYRRLPDAEPMIATQEFIIEHSERKVERGLAARGLIAFLFQRGLIDKNVERWEERLKTNGDDLVALSAITAAYSQAKPNESRRAELISHLTALEKTRSAAQAQEFEKQVILKPALAAMRWKDAAEAWRDAGNKEKALAAVAEALRAPPPDGILLHFFHRGIGEVYADCGKHAEAVTHLEKAVESTAIKGYKVLCRKALLSRDR